MANCRICNAKIGFKAAIRLDNLGANGGIINSIDVCENCSKDMSLLKKGDLQTYIKIHSIVDKADPFLKNFVGLWETLPEEIAKKQEEENKQKEEENKQKEEELKQKELLRKSILMTTGFSFETHRIVSYLGIKSGEIVLGTGLLSDASALVNDFFGTESNTLAAKLAQAKNAALAKMVERCIDAGANAVIGVDLDISTIGANMIVACANGTAVKVEPLNEL